APRHCLEGVEKRGWIRCAQPLQEKVVEAEGKLEGRVATGGAFGVEKDRPRVRGEDVLGAHVAMDQAFAPRGGDFDNLSDAWREGRVAQRRRLQIGGQPDRMKRLAIVERGPNVRPAGGCRVNA